MHRKHHCLPQGRESPKLNKGSAIYQDSEEWTKVIFILADGSEVERQVDEIELLEDVEERTGEEEELQNGEETGNESFLLAENVSAS